MCSIIVVSNFMVLWQLCHYLNQCVLRTFYRDTNAFLSKILPEKCPHFFGKFTKSKCHHGICSFVVMVTSNLSAKRYPSCEQTFITSPGGLLKQKLLPFLDCHDKCIRFWDRRRRITKILHKSDLFFYLSQVPNQISPYMWVWNLG